MKQLFPLLFVILLYSCGHHSTNGEHSSSGANTEETIPTGDFYKRYEGTIAGKRVVAHMQKFGTQVVGSYQYVGISQALTLNSWEDTTADDTFYLTETYGNTNMQDSVPHWKVQLVAGGLKGKWISGNGQVEYDIDLKEAYPEGSTRLQATYIRDSARLLESKPEPFAMASYSALMAEGNDAGAGFINEQVKKTLEVQDADLVSGLRNALKKYFDEYRKDNLKISAEVATHDESWTFNFSRNEELRVLYNDRGWLVLEDLTNEYTGGAHGNNASSFLNIDVQGRKVWEVNDVISDTAALKPLLTLASRNYFHTKAGEDADQAMLVDEVPPTGNFFILPEGVTFVYNPYEVASYANGEIQLFIPYKKLMTLLTPQFKARIHLSENAGIATL